MQCVFLYMLSGPGDVFVFFASYWQRGDLFIIYYLKLSRVHHEETLFKQFQRQVYFRS